MVKTATVNELIGWMKEKYTRFIDVVDDQFEKELKHEEPYKRIRNVLRKIYLNSVPLDKMKRPEYTVLDFEWKNCIIIDACRFDLYEKVTGCSNYCISVGSNTQGWFDKTFENRYYDIAYVSANPLISKYRQERLQKERLKFFKMVPVWWFGWDADARGTDPEKVTKEALQVRRTYPDKKMIVHYLQPHKPFIGENPINEQFGEEIIGVWDQLRRNIVSQERVWSGYEGNLRLVLKTVETLMEKLNGRTILSSDHGNMVGTCKFYGHLPNVRLKGLVKVPFRVLIQ